MQLVQINDDIRKRLDNIEHLLGIDKETNPEPIPTRLQRMQQTLAELRGTIENVRIDLTRRMDHHIFAAIEQHGKEMAHNGMTQTEREQLKEYVQDVVQIEIKDSFQQLSQSIAHSLLQL